MKKKETNVLQALRVPLELEKEINSYCKKNGIESRSEFYRYAAVQILKPDVEDPELVFSSLKQLHNKLHAVTRQQDILFAFVSFFARYFLAYHPEIPNELKNTAGKSASDRYDKAFSSFQEILKKTPNMFESLLADYFEE